MKLIEEAFDATEGNGEPYIRLSRVFVAELRNALVASKQLALELNAAMSAIDEYHAKVKAWKST